MRKDLGKQPAVFPMPVLMVAAYDEKGTVQVMNAAWIILISIYYIMCMKTPSRFIRMSDGESWIILRSRKGLAGSGI